MNLFERFEVLEDPRDIRGKKYGTKEAVKIASKIYWDSMKIDTLYKDFAQQSEEKKGRSR